MQYLSIRIYLYCIATLLLLSFNACQAYAFWSGEPDVNGKVILGSASLNNKKYDVDLIVNGSLEFSKLTAKNITINGSVSGSELECKELIVNGKSDINNANITSGEINGSSVLSDLVIEEDLKSSGGLKANNLNIGGRAELSGEVLIKDSVLDNVEIDSNKVTFINSKIKNIRAGEKTNHLYFTNGSIVLGNIIFESGKGKINLQQGAKILGKISGGSIASEKDEFDF